MSSVQVPGVINVMIETAMGEIAVELDGEHAPGTTANFLHYLDQGAYTGGRFHRTVHPENQPNDTVRIEVIQGGPSPDWDGETRPPLLLERTSETGLAHRDGVISMARFAPDSAVSDFFICINDQPSLDFGGDRNPDGQGFAAFGRVTAGMDIVRAIQQSPADGQALTPAVTINRITRQSPI